MRRINSEFKTLHISEEGQKLSNRDYFGFAEMDDYACYVLADSLDEEPSVNSAKLVVDSIIRDLSERPTMRKSALKRYLRRAHAELLNQRNGMHLKASVVIAVTDYRKLLYGHVGNSRLYWIRNARILERTRDQSLTQNLLEQEKIPMDEAAAHEERNNLYSFLGERGTPKFLFSRKKKLEDGDMFVLLTRGVWELCKESDFLQIINNAREPKDILDQTEDFILKEQEVRKIDNYTLAVTSVNKVYKSPKKPITLKKVLMIAIPVIVIVTALTLALYMRHRSIRTKTESLLQCMESGEEYLLLNNFPKAVEEYEEAKNLANSLKRTDEYQESDQCIKLAEQVIMADDALKAEDYQKAQELYLIARDMSMNSGNIGLSYIEGQLERTEGYIEVFDLIAQGERKEEYGNLEGAIELYREARERAASLYYSEGKAEAMELMMAATEELEKEQMEAEQILQAQIDAQTVGMAAENEGKENDRQSAIAIENQGNVLFAEGDYESAITFYRAAQAIYNRLELSELAEGIEIKISAAAAGVDARNAAMAEEAITEER